MSNEKNYIDELLKHNLEHFEADAPDVWQNIQSQVHNATQATTATAGKSSLSIITKSIIISATVITTSWAIYALINRPEETVKKVESNIQPVDSIGELVSATIKDAPVLESTVNNAAPLSTTTISATEPVVVPKHQLNKPFDGQEYKNDRERSLESLANNPAPQSEAEPSPPNPQPLESKMVKPINQVQSETTVGSTKESQEADSEMSNLNKEDIGNKNELFIQNVFSPNGDGVNDNFIIDIENEILYQVIIRDRQGNVLFESNDKNIHWDGIDKTTGKPCPAGVYVLDFLYQRKGEAKPTQHVGLITIRRNN